MASFAGQYQGYIATVEYPFVAGKANDDQMRFLGTLFEAANVQLKHLRAGALCVEKWFVPLRPCLRPAG